MKNPVPRGVFFRFSGFWAFLDVKNWPFLKVDFDFNLFSVDFDFFLLKTNSP